MEKRAWIISVNMGYGHQRTAFPLKDLSPTGEIICINDYSGIPEKDKRIWERTRRGYELISKLKRIPLIGEFSFFLFDQFQKIFSFYPKRDLSEPNFQLRQTFSLIKKGWGRHLIEKLKENPLPVVSTFFTSAFMAEHFDYPGEIFCIVCDADVSRTWAPFDPRRSKIKYFAPTSWVVSRLKLYGVKEENIFFTGYPLPQNLIGDEKMEILKKDLENRLVNLDPKKKYIRLYEPLIRKHLGYLPSESNHPLTLMFAVGGAGAQKEIGMKMVKSLKKRIKDGKIRIILVAGIKEKIKEYFDQNLKKLSLGENKNIEIIFEKDIKTYFERFNEALKKTDVLWTKPSELSFYAALGLPIIIAPTIGSQEEFNRKWLLKSGFGITQENPLYTSQWFFDFLESGRFAEAALQGFIEGEKLGTLKIKEIVEKQCG
ncbi:MAG: hypothetical protein PHE52_00285 [Candidatus Pacebacteria bacterium]|nr:hypothetical protein [Candidatus Paceibacterota bacterium]